MGSLVLAHHLRVLQLHDMEPLLHDMKGILQHDVDLRRHPTHLRFAAKKIMPSSSA